MSNLQRVISPIVLVNILANKLNVLTKVPIFSNVGFLGPVTCDLYTQLCSTRSNVRHLTASTNVDVLSKIFTQMDKDSLNFRMMAHSLHGAIGYSLSGMLNTCEGERV